MKKEPHGDGSNQYESKGAKSAPLQKTREKVAEAFGVAEKYMSGKIGQGTRTDLLSSNTTKSINDRGSTYKLNRLKRKRPEIAENKEPYNGNRYKSKI